MNVQCYHSMLAFWTIILHPRRMLNFTTLQLYKSNFLSELYNFTYLTFFPKYLCHLLMQVSLLLAFPIKLFIKSTPIILSRLLQTFLNSNWIRGTWHQKSLFSSKRDVYSSDPPSTYHPDGTRLGIDWDRSQMSVALLKSQLKKGKEQFCLRSDVYSSAPPSAYHPPPPLYHIPAS